MSDKQIQKWADEFMFTAEPSKAAEGPRAYLLQGTPDPLGSIAAFAKMYKGEVVREKRAITDDERRYYLEQMQATKLKAPMEAVDLHFMIEGVTRSFTHQMVRQRTAVYAQESLRFAVKEDVADAVALPPSLAGVEPHDEGTSFKTKAQEWLYEWDDAVLHIEQAYLKLVNSGMPAEDARGLLPHAITTRLNYKTNLRNLQDHSGNRLCTQAQFEWRMFWVRLTAEMRNYCTCPASGRSAPGSEAHFSYCDNWQWREISKLFRPVCYFTGKCEFKAEFDRKCSIRDRVEANHENGIPSSRWETDHYGQDGEVIPGINPAEWLMDDGAAR